MFTAITGFFQLCAAKVKGVRCCAKQLLYLYDYVAEKEIVESRFEGVCEVAVAQIRGSSNQGRCRDFDEDFRLLNQRGRERMATVARVWRERRLPPISLVRVGNLYFVQDGHHRVAICNRDGQARIRAMVSTLRLA